jgi:ABC-type transport system involved in multi-copper enzyme maturation permease subunit
VGFASSVAYGLVTFFGLLITIMLSMGILPGELESGSIVFQLTRPIGRSRFLLGKLLGAFYTIAVATFALTSGYYILLAARARVFYPGLYFGWALALLDLAAMLLFVALFTLLVPRVVAGLFGFLLFFASLIIGMGPIKQYFLSDQAGLPAKAVFIIFSVFIPHLEELWSIGKGFATQASFTLLELLPILYVALYALALLSIALVLFQKRDL